MTSNPTECEFVRRATPALLNLCGPGTLTRTKGSDDSEATCQAARPTVFGHLAAYGDNPVQGRHSNRTLFIAPSNDVLALRC